MMGFSVFRLLLPSIILAISLLGTPLTAVAQQTPALGTEGLHQELRDLRDRALKDFAANDIEALLSEFTDTLQFTSIDNQTISGKDAARAYYAAIFDPGNGLLTDISATLEPDALSTLYLGGQMAVSAGTSTVTLKTRAGTEVTLPVRWTATLVRADNAWKVAAIHFSANVLDNPISNDVTHLVTLGGVGLGVAGLLVGWLVGRRRRKA